MTKHYPRVPCGALTKEGRPCPNWAVHGSDPPRCASHGGGTRRVGAPPGTRSNLKHGAYMKASSTHTAQAAEECDMTIFERLERELTTKLARLAVYIDRQLETEEVPALESLFLLYARMAWRLGWMRRQVRSIRKAANLPDPFWEAVNKELEELGNAYGYDSDL